MPGKDASDLSVELEPFGPTPDDLESASRRLLAHSEVKKLLKGARYRVLSTVTLEADEARKIGARPRPPDRIRTVIYDYSNHRSLLVTSSVSSPDEVTVEESGTQPAVTDEEFAEALRELQGDQEIGSLMRDRHLRTFRPIPPVIAEEMPDGRHRRLVTVGLLSNDRRGPHEIVAVDLFDHRVIRFPEHAPPGAAPPNNTLCGVPVDAGQRTANKGTAGQVWIRVKRGRTTLWRFLAVRPAASSGTNGSGIELRYVDYRGKRVLYRAHVPILNVKYDRDACGPYRDWQYEEGQIQAAGQVVAPGFMLCNGKAQTIMDTGSDTGNFLGVGIYVAGSEVVLVSEMEAGWYRYVSEWRLGADGTIRPRFGFAAVESRCVCNRHHHHVYWRFDFDILTAGGNRVSEFNQPPIIGGQNWHTKHFEIRRPRDPARARRWRVEHVSSGAAYEIVPRPEDGIAAQMPDWPFGRGDVWILRYRGTEIDDSVVATGPPYEADLDRWVNGEAIQGRDVVVWYGAHFTHDVHEGGPATHGHIVGPDLHPVNWPR
jgi:hypothetical protein